MPKHQESLGCRRMLRRTFLFLITFVVTQLLADFFSFRTNRENFFQLLGELQQKFLAFLSSLESNETPEPLPSTPVVRESKTPETNVTKEPDLQPFEHQSPSPIKPAPKKALPPKKARPVEQRRRTIAGVSFYQTTIDLADPEVFITIELANNAAKANNPNLTNGDEPFGKMVGRQQAAVVANGTFFGKDAQKSVLGNMVAAGKFLKYSRWENYGTTLGIKAGNQLEMITARLEGKPDWNQYWFSLTCGPRLVKQGKVSLSPISEGFKDSHVLGVGARTAIGFPESRQELFLVTFLNNLSLQQEAEIMKAIGCVEAMNLDGGASVGLAHKGRILVSPGRNLTNVMAIYDVNYPAPSALKTSWQRFQNGDRPSPDEADFFD